MDPVDNGALTHGAVEDAHDPSGRRVVKLIGEIDLSNADALGTTLEHLTRDADDHLVIDLSALEFMDSSGLAMLLRTAGRVGTVEVVNPSAVVRRIIECTGLAEILRMTP